MNATRILALKPEQHGVLFSGKKDEREAEYRRLRSQWHPDKGGNADVFHHITVLYEASLAADSTGWRLVPGVGQPVLEMRTTAGKDYSLAVRTHWRFELGAVYSGDRTVVYLIERQYDDLVRRAVSHIKALKYSTTEARQENERYMPKLLHVLDLPDHLAVVLTRSSSTVPLRNVMRYHGGRLPPEHVAWMTSWMFNAACFMQYHNNMFQGGMSVDDVWVDYADHSGTLLGGWWYAANSSPLALPARTVKNANYSSSDPRAGHKLAGQLIRVFCRELLGDVNGTSLLRDNKIPRPMLLWAMGTASHRLLNDFIEWHSEVLPAAFGKRRFVKMEIDHDKLYQEAL